MLCLLLTFLACRTTPHHNYYCTVLILSHSLQKVPCAYAFFIVVVCRVIPSDLAQAQDAEG